MKLFFHRALAFFLVFVLTALLMPGTGHAAAGSAVAPEDTSGTIQTASDGEAGSSFLVTDIGLYEMMVHGRYFDLWDRRSAYFLDPTLYVYEKTLDNIHETDAGIEWMTKVFGSVFLDQKINQESFLQLLIMLICQQANSFSQSVRTLADYDTLKTLDDYQDDLLSMGWDALAETGIAADVINSLLSSAQDVGEELQASAELVQNLENAKENYDNAVLFLDVIIHYSDNTVLCEAAENLKGLLQDSFWSRADTALRQSGSFFWEEGGNTFIELFLDILSDAAGTKAWAAGLKSFCDATKQIVFYAPGLTEAKFAFQATFLAGDALFGTTDTYNRFVEMTCLSEIAEVLFQAADVYGYSPCYQKGSISMAREAVPILQFLLLTEERGEYCVEQLVLSDGGVQTLLVGAGDSPSAEEITAWFDAETDLLSEMYADLDMILCTGDEVYYRYLEQVLLPKYGWASQDPATFTIPDPADPSLSTAASDLKDYLNPETGETGTGILSAVVRDFNGDRISDMLVVFADTADASLTAVEPVYSKGEAVVLRFALYTMQYSSSGTGAAEIPPTVPATPEPSAAANAWTDPYELTHIDPDDLGPQTMLEWFQIQAGQWTPLDRYNVYEAAAVEIAAEMAGITYGGMLAGICTMDGVPYIYTYEDMSDTTAYGPHLTRVWHVEETNFVFDSAYGWIGWGQETQVEDINAALGAGGVNFTDTKLSVVDDLLPKAVYPDADLSALEGSLLCRLTLDIIENGINGTRVLCKAEDHSLIRRILMEGYTAVAPEIPEEPDFTPAENSGRDSMDQLAADIGNASGYPMTVSGNSELDGTFTVWYVSSTGQSTLTISMDGNGKLTRVAVDGDNESEFIAIKDAILQQESLGLDENTVSSLSGPCGYGIQTDIPVGSVFVMQINNYKMGISFE